MSLLESIVLKPISIGSSYGILSFHLTFTGENPPEEEIGLATADPIFKITHSGWKTKNITLQGKFPRQDVMTTLIMGLKRAGFQIHAIIDGSVGYAWLSLTLKGNQPAINWLTVDLRSVAWPVFAADEVVYRMTSITDPEPDLPDNTTRYFLLPPKGLSVQDLQIFLRKSQTRWHVTADRNPVEGMEVRIE